jgi:hypothetical protein
MAWNPAKQPTTDYCVSSEREIISAAIVLEGTDLVALNKRWYNESTVCVVNMLYDRLIL